MFEDMVIKKKRELRVKNLQDLRLSLDSPDVKLKISNYATEHGFLVEEIRQEIIDNDLVASFFAKDPVKQNFTELLVAELLKTKVLPQQGKNCIRFDEDGNICSTKGTTTTKAADFYINNTYITQKYTRSTGGAQDNQYNDVVDFLIKGSKKHKVAAIVDGSYWDDLKRKELRDYFELNPNVQILSMDDYLNGGVIFE